MREYDEEFREEDMSVSAQTDAEFRAYIEAHTGPDMKDKKPREKLETLASLATAYMMLKASSPKKKFSTNMIHRMSEKIKQTLDLTDLHEAEIDDMLSSLEKLRKGVNHRLTTLYANTQAEKNMSEYIRNMKTLADNMPMDESRSKDYNVMAKCIKDIATMNPNASRDELIAKNYKLMQSIEKNINGKERVRRTDMGVEHFNTSLDALAIMTTYNPALEDKTGAIVDKINYTRGSEMEAHKDHVDIKNFGTKRAIDAKKNRAEKAKERRLERTLDKDKLKKKQMEMPKMGM